MRALSRFSGLALLLGVGSAHAGIDVLSASYGPNCAVPAGNATAAVAAACNGRTQCNYTVDYHVLGDPAPGCAKTFAVQWRCSTDGSSRALTLPAEAGFGSVAHLGCTSPAAAEAHIPPPPPPPPPPIPLPIPEAQPQSPAPIQGEHAGQHAKPPAADAPAQDAPYVIVKVYYGTDRQDEGESQGTARYTGKRGTMSYGSCLVSMPKYHKPGELETPSIWKLQFTDDPARFVVLMSVDLASEVAMFSRLAEDLAKSGSRSALVFVHGYNVTFADAARRTAQIAYDMHFDGVPLFYSWPSRGKTAAYTVDEESVEWTEKHLEQFLADVVSQSQAENIYLVAHSMGNRALTRAFSRLVEDQPALAGKVRELVLTAPDIDAQVFREQIAPGLVRLGTPVTLYASSKDLALKASKKVHGYARAGDSGGDLIVLPGLETIDATAVDTSLLGHSYVGDSPSMLKDLSVLFEKHLHAAARADLTPVTLPAGNLYWALEPAAGPAH